MWCPECGSEFREGFTRCTECGVELTEVAPEEPVVGPEWVEVAGFTSREEAELARGFLIEEGIPAEVVDRHTSTYPYSIGLRPEAALEVPPEHEERARALLDDAEAGRAAAPDLPAEPE